MENPQLTVKALLAEARRFAERESAHPESSLFGVDNGKTVGTYLEQKFRNYLLDSYTFPPGNAAKGIDFPDLGVDIKVTSVKQPQSSCPFTSARQKIFGLGYSVLVFVYEKTDDSKSRTAILNFLHTVFVEKEHTADFQTTSGLLKLLDNDANEDDLIAFLQERMLPAEEIAMTRIAKELLNKPPLLGYLTISNALQWRLQYSRAIERAGKVPGVLRIR
jgi:hypothetical protein